MALCFTCNNKSWFPNAYAERHFALFVTTKVTSPPPMQNGTLPPLASDVDLLSVAARCSNLSGADCMNVVKTASVYAIQELDRWRARGKSSIEFSSTNKNGTNYSTNNSVSPKDDTVTDKAASTKEYSLPLLSNSVPLTVDSVQLTDNSIPLTDNLVPLTESSVPSPNNLVTPAENPVQLTVNSITSEGNLTTLKENAVPSLDHLVAAAENSVSVLRNQVPTFAVRETASLGIMGVPWVPPLNPSETIVLSEQSPGILRHCASERRIALWQDEHQQISEKKIFMKKKIL